MTTKHPKLKIFLGVATLVATLAALLFVAYPCQRAFGMLGLAMTEILVALIALVAALFPGMGLKATFRLRVPKLREFFGAMLIWVGTFLIITVVSAVEAYFFPEQMAAVSEDLSDFVFSVSPALVVLISAVLPAICEEMLFRGVILHSFKPMPKWLRIALVGLFFGIFHLDPLRFLITAICGAAMAFVVDETDNLALSITMHFTQNMLPSLVELFAATEVAEAAADAEYTVEALGATLIVYGIPAPFLVLAGVFLLGKRKHPLRLVLLAALVAVLFCAAGNVLVAESVGGLVTEFVKSI